MLESGDRKLDLNSKTSNERLKKEMKSSIILLLVSFMAATQATASQSDDSDALRQLKLRNIRRLQRSPNEGSTEEAVDETDNQVDPDAETTCKQKSCPYPTAFDPSICDCTE